MDPTALVRPLAAALDAVLRPLASRQSTVAIACALLPLLVVALFPSGYSENESQYLMLAHRQVAPEAFSPNSAAFDHTHARFLTQWLMGGVVHVLGYEAGQIVLRVLMMLLYAATVGLFFAAIRLSMLESMLVFAAYGLLGPDLMGAEWLFLGVETKTFAYAAAFAAFALAWRGRTLAATGAMALATWLHFLVGGFWMGALLLLEALRRGELRTLVKPFAVYVAAVLPLLAIVVYDQYGSGAAAVPAHGMTADFLYSVLRVPHHTQPFTDLYRLGFWLNGVVATAGLLAAFLLLAGKGDVAGRPLYLWLALLLLYLLLVFALSAFDVKSGALGKFLPFRPSALTLFFCITALLLAVRRVAGATSSGSAGSAGDASPLTLQKAAFLVVVPLFLWVAAKEHVKTIAFGFGYDDLPQVLRFLEQQAGPEDIVLTDPQADMQPIGAHLPRLIKSPTLVNFKFVPLNPADIYRWWDLLEFRKAVYAGTCPKPGDRAVRFLLYIGRPAAETPACGEVVFRSSNFMVAELPPSAGG